MSGPIPYRAPLTAPGSADEIRNAIRQAINTGAISIVYQPIIDLAAGEVVGYEALTRLETSDEFPHTGALFASAEEVGLLEDLEAAARELGLRSSRNLPPGCLLFINNSPDVFCQPNFGASLDRVLESCPWLTPRRIVLEVTEQSAPTSDQILDRHVLEMRERGYAVAIDDVGSGMNGLKRMMALRPNWLKLDIDLINDIENDPYKQSVIKFVVHFAKLCNMRIVAEGVERHEQLERLIELGVSHAQGYFIARPGALDQPVRDGLDSTVRFLQEKAGLSRFRNPLTTTMGSLVEPVSVCPSDVTVAAARSALDSAPDDRGVVLMDRRRVVGWVPVSDLPRSADDANAPLARHCRADNLLVAPDLSLEEALEIVSNRPEQELPQPLVVSDVDGVVGIVTLRRLLSAAAVAHSDVMRHVSPLTGLPNRVQADLWLGERIERNDPADIAFVDLHFFEAYNAAYGFEFGDSMLKTLAGLIRSILVESDRGALFVAHLSEDRFLLAFHDDSRHRLEQLVHAFNEVRDQFFNAMDRAVGAFASIDSGGHRRVLPLTSVRALLLPKALLRICAPGELYEMERRLHDASRPGAGGHAADLPGIIIDPTAPTVAARRSA